MKLSIIVPVYNMAEGGKLQFCLDSLLHQTIAEQGVEYEILGVNDASTDHSFEILQEYEKEYPEKVKAFTYPDNRRQGGAKNYGLKKAVGEWISFIDSDDWVSPDFYEKLLRKAEETGADIVGCDYNLVDSHTFTVGKIVKNNTLDQTGLLDEEKHRSLVMRPGSMVIKIYKGDIIRDNHLDFPEKIFYEDNCAGPVWSLYFHHFEKVEEPLYYYYQHDTSTVHYVSEEKCRDRMSAGILLHQEFQKRGFEETYFPQLEYRFTELYFINTLFTYMQFMKKKRYGFVKELYEGQKTHFPQFAQNRYYIENTGEEYSKMIALMEKSVPVFFWYYRFKLWVRGIRKSLRQKKETK